MNIIFSVGYNEVLINDVSASFVDKLTSAIQIDTDYLLGMSYKSENNRTSVTVVLNPIMSHEEHKAARAEYEAKKKAEEAAKEAKEAAKEVEITVQDAESQ
jgi:hypothetical protein